MTLRLEIRIWFDPLSRSGFRRAAYLGSVDTADSGFVEASAARSRRVEIRGCGAEEIESVFCDTSDGLSRSIPARVRGEVHAKPEIRASTHPAAANRLDQVGIRSGGLVFLLRRLPCIARCPVLESVVRPVLF